MHERPIIIEDQFSNWDVVVGRTVVKDLDRSVGFVVSTIALRHSPFTRVTDFETMVYNFLGYKNSEDGNLEPTFDCHNENPQLGIDVRLMEHDGATVETAKEYHYKSVDRLASMLESQR